MDVLLQNIELTFKLLQTSLHSPGKIQVKIKYDKISLRDIEPPKYLQGKMTEVQSYFIKHASRLKNLPSIPMKGGGNLNFII